MQKIQLKPTLSFYCLLVLLFFVSCSNQQTSPSSEPTTSSSDMTETEDEILDSKTILFFGNSLTAGYGLELSDAFPAIIQQKIDSLGLGYTVINAGLSGETTADGKSRIDWLLEQKIDIFVLELGANDGLRGVPPTATRNNLKAIIQQVRTHYPNVKVLLCGMEVPPNLGETYASAFRTIYKDISDSLNTHFLPFLLDKVAGEPELNLADGIHPTVEGHKIVAENIWEALRPLL